MDGCRACASLPPKDQVREVEMAGGKTRQGGSECDHAQAIAITSAGVKRYVCETCGHVSFEYSAEMTGQVDRDRFARPADRLSQLAAAAR